MKILLSLRSLSSKQKRATRYGARSYFLIFQSYQLLVYLRYATR